MKQLFIFIICQNIYNGYDTYDSHVIVANGEQQVIDLANKNPGDEGSIWNNATIENIGTYTGNETEPFILLSSFNAG